MPLQSATLSSARRKFARADRRPQFHAARAFYITVFVISVIAVINLVANGNNKYGLDNAPSLLRRRTTLNHGAAFTINSREEENTLRRRDESVCNESPLYALHNAEI